MYKILTKFNEFLAMSRACEIGFHKMSTTFPRIVFAIGPCDESKQLKQSLIWTHSTVISSR